MRTRDTGYNAVLRERAQAHTPDIALHHFRTAQEARQCATASQRATPAMMGGRMIAQICKRNSQPGQFRQLRRRIISLIDAPRPLGRAEGAANFHARRHEISRFSAISLYAAISRAEEDENTVPLTSRKMRRQIRDSLSLSAEASGRQRVARSCRAHAETQKSLFYAGSAIYGRAPMAFATTRDDDERAAAECQGRSRRQARREPAAASTSPAKSSRARSTGL